MARIETQPGEAIPSSMRRLLRRCAARNDAALAIAGYNAANTAICAVFDASTMRAAAENKPVCVEIGRLLRRCAARNDAALAIAGYNAANTAICAVFDASTMRAAAENKPVCVESVISESMV